MFSLENHVILRKISVSCLITCIYLSSIVTVVSYQGLLYSVGNASSSYILVFIFVAELLKSFYLISLNNTPAKKSKNRVTDVIKSTVFLFGVMLCFFIGIILFGAPVLDSHEETLMLSALLTLLTMFPLVCHNGVGAAMQMLFGIKSYPKDSVTEMLVNNAVLTVCGAWLGAVVVPLDWNTPWQKWPIPCYLGALGGYLLSNMLTVTKISLMKAAHKYPFCNVFINAMNKFHVTK